MNIKTDLHCHTLVSTHAYSTIQEYVDKANKIGLEMIAITDHGMGIDDSPHRWHFSEMSSIVPNIIDGIYVLHGVEANIMTHNGEIDIPEKILQSLNWVIASYHIHATKPGSFDEHTTAYLNIMENKYVDVIGHSGTEFFPFDHDKVIKKAAEYDKIIEINEKTFSTRKESVENCVDIAKLCKKYGVKISVNSDSHFTSSLGNYPNSTRMLSEIGFSKDLIVNLNAQRVMEYMNNRTGRKNLSI